MTGATAFKRRNNGVDLPEGLSGAFGGFPRGIRPVLGGVGGLPGGGPRA